MEKKGGGGMADCCTFGWGKGLVGDKLGFRDSSGGPGCSRTKGGANSVTAAVNKETLECQILNKSIVMMRIL